MKKLTEEQRKKNRELSIKKWICSRARISLEVGYPIDGGGLTLEVETWL